MELPVCYALKEHMQTMKLMEHVKIVLPVATLVRVLGLIFVMLVPQIIS